MNANKILDDLSCKLDSFNPAERKNALEEFKKAFVTTGESFVCEKNDNNMHCHTFFYSLASLSMIVVLNE